MWSNISAPTRSSLQQFGGVGGGGALEQVKQERNYGQEQPNNKLNGQQQQPLEDGTQTENVAQNQRPTAQSGSPLMRYKHAVCSAPCGYIYIHGGRFGNLPLDDDLWRFDPHQNSWLQLETGGCKPPSLQEHTLVEYNDRLYLFGGQVSTSNTESSFWCLDLLENEWRSLSMRSSKFGAHLGPTNRRGHSAVIYGYSMFIYGGFEDFRGSSGQLWEYDLINERWELRNLSSTSALHPEPRHSHSAIVHDHNMYIYGGLTNLKPLGDLWRWSWRDKRWYKERTRGRSPGQLHGHTAIQAFDSMFVFGGERNGRTTGSLWRLNLTSMTWQKVRAKGPRPNPTTWHGAIANPLNMLDETNYIIEGDLSDGLFKSSTEGGLQMLPLGGDVATCLRADASLQTNGGGGNHTNIEAQTIYASEPHQPISHSKSSSAEVNGWSTGNSAPVARSSTTKRKSRLSFLRRSRQDRPRSTYELKQIQISASANNFPQTNISNRHSIHVTPLTCTDGGSASNRQGFPSRGQLQVRQQQRQTKIEPPETNVKILDNLDTDIKQMFQRAMSPVHGDERQLAIDHDEYGEEEEDELMSVDTIHQPSATTNTHRSHYETARQDNSRATAVSQRTSYAYTTPPSELNTLTQQRDLVNTVKNDERDGRSRERETMRSQRSVLVSALSRAPPFGSGYDKRDNRPKSEIVQSLIDRADAQIKHHYTPFFNQSTHHQQAPTTTSTATRAQRRNHPNRLSLDKSKRHTIPQTMTYYNLYFSEDKSSNSPPTSGQEDAQSMEGGPDCCGGQIGGALAGGVNVKLNGQQAGEQVDLVSGVNRMTRDDASSNTIRGMATSAAATSSGTLVGVHGYLNPAILAQMDQVSQLSLETLNSSESRTLCANEMHNLITSQHGGGAGSQVATFSAVSSVQSSLQNALTGRRDTAESCDNTSLSFSMIAEFEEDDMLQYSSPTDPIINADKLRLMDRQRMGNEMARISPPEDPIQSSPQAASNNGPQSPEVKGPANTNGATTEGKTMANIEGSVDRRQAMAHKSVSSGYDSMTGGFDQLPLSSSSSSNKHPSVQASGAGMQHYREQTRRFGGGEVSGASEDTTHENSSVHTESSFGITTTTETSPEQSAMKKLKGRAFMINRKQDKPFGNKGSAQTTNTTTTTSSITADSLALTSDGFESSSMGIMEPQPTITKSLPASPPENRMAEHRLDSIQTGDNHRDTQRKVPIISRSKFFGKQKPKTRFWQLCMFVIGGKQVGAHGLNEPINIWRLYI